MAFAVVVVVGDGPALSSATGDDGVGRAACAGLKSTQT